MRYFFLFILITTQAWSSQKQTPKSYFWQMTKQEIKQKIIHFSKIKDFDEKIKKITHAFNKTPYVLNALGEGKKKPLYSFKGVDCVTYVETVLAIANSKNLKEAITLLQKIRYKNGEIAYHKRHHFMMMQWVPSNVKLGLLKEVTAKYGKVKTMKKQIQLSDFSGKFKAFKELKEQLPLGHFEVNYIPIQNFLKRLHRLKIKTGTVLVIIRENKKKYPLFTSHLGFVVQTKKGPLFRSAVTNSRFKEVRDYKLYGYLNFYYHYYLKKSWKIVGVALYEPQELHGH